ncbi:MAG: hypothetical protein WD379_09385 [Dehalococcoidia bacterium]
MKAGPLAPAAFIAALATLALLVLASAPDSRAQQGLTAIVDADPAGNTGSSLGTAQGCISVANTPGTPLQIDVTADTIPSGVQVTGFNYFLSFDDSRLRLTAKEHNLLMVSTGGEVTDLGDNVVDAESPHKVAIVDLSTAPMETGPLAGALGRYTFEVLANAPAGLATFSLSTLGIFDDAGQEIPMEGSLDGFVAVGQDCPSPLPTQQRAPDGTAGTGGTGDGNGDGSGGGSGGGDETPADGQPGEGTPTAEESPGEGDQTPGPDGTPGAEASPTPDGDDPGNEDSDDDDGGLSIWVIVLIVLAVIALAAGAGWWWWRRRQST